MSSKAALLGIDTTRQFNPEELTEVQRTVLLQLYQDLVANPTFALIEQALKEQIDKLMDVRYLVEKNIDPKVALLAMELVQPVTDLRNTLRMVAENWENSL